MVRENYQNLGINSLPRNVFIKVFTKVSTKFNYPRRTWQLLKVKPSPPQTIYGKNENAQILPQEGQTRVFMILNLLQASE